MAIRFNAENGFNDRLTTDEINSCPQFVIDFALPLMDDDGTVNSQKLLINSYDVNNDVYAWLQDNFFNEDGQFYSTS